MCDGVWLQVPPALQIAPGGVLLEEDSGKPAVLRGINWFGWHVGSFNFDGLWVSGGNQSISPPARATFRMRAAAYF